MNIRPPTRDCDPRSPKLPRPEDNLVKVVSIPLARHQKSFKVTINRIVDVLHLYNVSQVFVSNHKLAVAPKTSPRLPFRSFPELLLRREKSNSLPSGPPETLQHGNARATPLPPEIRQAGENPRQAWDSPV
ncbi:hypothetical protein HWI79_865 [Cryptosporidium felis]|nr:hypothetical protein HWI79_865 [Cryptosporidium felis]